MMDKRLVDEKGRYRTASLFFETLNPVQKRKGYTPVYTLRPFEHNGLPSAYKIYMASVDEYDAAIRLVGDLKHWRKLLECDWFMKGCKKKLWEGLEQWREDKALKDRSMAIAQLMEQADKGSVTAQKAILETTSEKATPARGRPKKEKDTSHLDEQASKIAVLYNNTIKKKA